MKPSSDRLITRALSICLASVLAVSILFPGDGQATPRDENPLSQPGPTFSVLDSQLPKNPSIIFYGDMRFTDPSNAKVANPRARRLLAERVASDRPDGLELTGDVVYDGSNPADYDEFRSETGSWRAANLRVYPVLGNHELT